MFLNNLKNIGYVSSRGLQTLTYFGFTKKFLKSNQAEFACCYEYVQALALAKPCRSFSLTHNGREKIKALDIYNVLDGEWYGELALKKRINSVCAISAP